MTSPEISLFAAFQLAFIKALILQSSQVAESAFDPASLVGFNGQYWLWLFEAEAGD